MSESPVAKRLSEASVVMEGTPHPELVAMLKIGAEEIQRLWELAEKRYYSNQRLEGGVERLEVALREIADFSKQFIGDDEDGDERMYKVNQIADTALGAAASGATTAVDREGEPTED
jgi:hypothetical protein